MRNVTLTVEIDELGSPKWGNLDSLTEDELCTLVIDSLGDFSRRYPQMTMGSIINIFSETCPDLKMTWEDIYG